MTSSDEFLNIDTPENVAFDFEVVGIGSRFMAALIDTLIIAVIQAVVLLALTSALRLQPDLESRTGTIIAALLSLISFLLLWGYYIFFEMQMNGRSPGKQTMNLRVIRQDGTPITLNESIIRNLVRLVDFMPIGYGVGVISMFVDGKARRLGDLAAGTIVIRDQEEVTLESLKQTATSENFYVSDKVKTMTVEWPVHLLSESDVQLAKNFLIRRNEIKNNSVLASQIAKKLMSQMEVSSPLSREMFQSYAIHILSSIVNMRRRQRIMQTYGKQLP